MIEGRSKEDRGRIEGGSREVIFFSTLAFSEKTKRGYYQGCQKVSGTFAYH
jgi:hypothetical protein